MNSIPLSVFGLGNGTYPCLPPDHPLAGLVPQANPGYRFPPEATRDLLTFLAHAGGDGLYLTGPTGAGKTSLILEVAARLNWPVRRVQGHARLELTELLGGLGLAAEGGGTRTVFRYGPLAQAVREGSIFILDEIDLVDPAITAGLNALLEGNGLVLADNGGEVIRPHPMFRLIATGNTAGLGDDTGVYAGTLTQNLAFLDRFWVVQVNYPDAAIEDEILAAAVPGLPPQVREAMIKVANEVRRQFIGSGSPGATLGVTFSTRTLIRWGRILTALSRAPIEDKVGYALDRALTMRARPHEREAILAIAYAHFGREER